MTVFADRREAGECLAALLQQHLIDETRPLQVLALPRGGVPVADAVARVLQAPLDVLLVRKLGSPGNPELGIGAVVEAEPPLCLLNDEIVEEVGATPDHIEAERLAQCALLAERHRLYRGERPLPSIEGSVVVLVDDGIATGVSLQAALRGLAARGAARIVVAVPVAPLGIDAALGLAPADFVCVLALAQLHSVSASYGDFTQTSDKEVLALLDACRG